MLSTRLARTPRRIVPPATAPVRRAIDARDAARPAPVATFGVTLWFGLVAGVAELACELLRLAVFGQRAWLAPHQLNRHFLWMIPAASILMMAPLGVLLSVLTRALPRKSVVPVVWSLVFLAAFMLLATARSIYLGASAVVSIGFASLCTPWLARRWRALLRLARPTGPVLALVVAGLAMFSFAREFRQERRALDRLAAPPAEARNVLLIVLDTVRADALSPYGSQRDTTPNLSRLSTRGVRFQNARATAPWTLPSHASIFTGHWPHSLGVSLTSPLDGTHPTLAAFLGRRGYATGGFAANYSLCTKSYGVSRGFCHYEERPVSLADVLGCSALGQRLLPGLDCVRYAAVWAVAGRAAANSVQPFLATHRKSAAEINDAFLGWVSGVNGRPFFAFLNYFDAHSPYIPPGDRTQHFGLYPTTWSQYDTLRDWEKTQEGNRWSPVDEVSLSKQDIVLARDAYDDCLAYLDRELGRLFAALEQRGLLNNTLVIVTSDHGEEFGEHDLFFHFASLHRPELDVPLLMAFPGQIPAGTTVSQPVSLRNLPATVVDLLQLNATSPFPGPSLARYWNGGGPVDELGEAAYSELSELGLECLRADSFVYIKDAEGHDHLYDVANDPGEFFDLGTRPEHATTVRGLRERLARLRAASPRPGVVR